MSSLFPDQPDIFTGKINNVDTINAEDINNLQDSIVRIENSLSPLIKADSSLLTLCHYENTASGYRNVVSSASGAVRYVEGKYDNGVFIERGALNFVKNPALRTSDSLWTFTPVTGSMTCSRVSSDFPPGINSGYSLQIQASASGDSEASIKTSLEGLSVNTAYAISFYVKNIVTGNNFSGIEMKIAKNDGSGTTGPTFSVTDQWVRVSGIYTTAADQDSFNLVVRFGKTGAAVNDRIYFGGLQVEQGSLVSGYCDGSQGTGFAWTGSANASDSIRSNTIIQYPVSSGSAQWLNSDRGTIGFWIKPGWDNGDSLLRYLFDTSVTATGKQVSIYKDSNNKLNFKITEPGAQFAAVQTNSAPDWEPSGGWKLITCTYNFDTSANTWTLHIHIDGQPVSSTASGSAATSNLPGSYMYLGASGSQEHYADGVFDDFFTYNRVLSDVEISRIYDSPIQMSEGILRATIGADTTDAVIGTEKAVAHSLGEIPSFIEITEKGAGIVYLSNPATNQYFYVKSTASSIDFDWRAWK
jgi:hypothetical protein